MIQTVDNFIALDFNFDNKKLEINHNDYIDYTNQNDVKNNLHITLKDYKANKNNFIFSEEKDSEDDLIISIKKTETESDQKYIAQTGNYIGRFRYNGIDIDIKSRFSDTFLKRMLNFANDVYLDDVDVSGKITKKEEMDYSKFILYYLFVQSLEKAFLLGLPKSYRSIKHHDMKLKGNIDINRFIRHDIPFRGKVSSVSREQKEIQEIIDVLHKAVSIIEKSKQIATKNISHVKTHLKQHKSKQFVSHQTIQKALSAKALNNPIFAPYKKVLEYAKYIINANTLEQDNSQNKKTYGFVINVAMLFEIYVRKLLQKEFSDWSVSSPQDIELYENNFFVRKIIPDIVMQRDNQILVFDTKYKRMKFDGRNQYGAGDVDRNDFFQINTYMTYYHNQGYEVIAGGLLYPMEGSFDTSKTYADNWLGRKETKFVIDGIELNDIKEDKEAFDRIREQENIFVGRIADLIQGKPTQIASD